MTLYPVLYHSNMSEFNTPTQRIIAAATLISQGAEAKVYKAELHPPAISGSTSDEGYESEPVLIKHRFNKQYRHPTLDASLTKSRVAGEARAINKCLRAGVNVPGVRMVDLQEGVLGIQWIDGQSIRFLLGGGAEGEEEVEEVDDDGFEEDATESNEDSLKEYNITQDDTMQLIGKEIAKMHKADIIHGDLTTSNMMLRRPSASDQVPELVLIDFGLSYTSSLVEDKAVDLYVLERAFASTHPASESLFGTVMKAYEKEAGKEWKTIGRRLDDVRLRGRKRSMIG
ncbi:hypothetical protein QCA50_001098 [Cerrena zonata]|uniref:EKC/KEOPS complex subunit BUD32 n=1 Tax=Cerrena zonata TaxID=2478898 RepID=A0AAW0GSC9_9APHY